MGITARELRTVRQFLIDCKSGALVTVVEVKGSAPRGPGTAMVVAEDSITGSIGGGRLEFEAIAHARKLITQRSSAVVRERYPLGDRLGQCCGGSVELLFEPILSEWNTWVSDALEALEQGNEYTRTCDDGFVHCVKPPLAHLVLCGAGHVGRALVHVLGNAPIRIHWVDERSEEFPANIPANVVCEVTDLPDVVVKNAPENCAVLITTHRHDLDFSIAESALSRTDIVYCGLIGSASKRARFERLWRQRNPNDIERLKRLTCPIGGQGPSGKEPEVVAIAVAAEILCALQEFAYS